MPNQVAATTRDAEGYQKDFHLQDGATKRGHVLACPQPRDVRVEHGLHLNSALNDNATQTLGDMIEACRGRPGQRADD